MTTVSDSTGNVPLQPIDLLLEQGSPDELRALRQRVAEDPTTALELADTVALVEQLRTLRTEPSPRYAGKLYAVVHRARRRTAPRVPRTPWLAMAAAAGVGFGLTLLWDALRREPGVEREAAAGLEVRVPDASPDQTADGTAVVVPTAAELARRDALGLMRWRFELESATHLAAALESAVNAERDPLASWLAPRNALAIRKLDHELRTHPEIRLRALRSEGAMLAADQRAQSLADAVAAELQRGVPGGTLPVRDVALGVRALIAAGVRPGARAAALHAGSTWLADHLPRLAGEDRVLALGALVECAAVEVGVFPGVAAAGEELVDTVLLADEETWERRRPFLLSGRVASSVLGDAGRALAMLPALGVDGARCEFVRYLLLGELRERRDRERDGPDLLAATLYGFGDLLTVRERDELVLQLSRWKPARLAPDFVTVHQIAWGVAPGRRGFTRLQRELRQLVILPDPTDLAGRAALCLSLTSNYAAARSESLERFAAGD